MSVNEYKCRLYVTDVLFRCEDGDVAAHRAMLVARCEWMSSLFNDNFRESTLKVVGALWSQTVQGDCALHICFIGADLHDF